MLYWVLLMLVVSPLCATDLGKLGHLFPIQEESLLEVLQRQACSRQDLVQEFFRKARHSLEHPTAVEGIGKAKRDRVFFVDPSIEVLKDIEDEGNIIVQKETKVNPFDYQTLIEPILFFDGDDEKQVEWARGEGKAKWVLVSGRPFALEEEENVPVFFDQSGFLSQKLSLKYVPAKVSQDGKFFKVEEFFLE